MTEEILFSVVVPTYNRASLLPRTISSILAQKYGGFELLIVDDGSTDNTREVVLQIAAGDSRVKYLHQANAERGAARNNGIKNAAGRFVVFFDSDDEMKPGYLSILQAGISSHPEYDFYAAKYNYIIEGREQDSGVSPLREGSYGLDLVLEGNPFSCNFCIRLGNKHLVLFREQRGLSTMEDWMFLVENLSARPIYLMAGVGLGMHQHDGRSMQQNQLLISRRIAATRELAAANRFTPEALKKLWAYTYYFCSIHAYLDGARAQSLAYIGRAMKRAGLNRKFITASLKYLAGRNVINIIKGRR